MNELVSVFASDLSVRCCDSEELHRCMEVQTRHRDWMPRRIKECGLIEGKDFRSILSESRGGRPQTKYVLTVETAKHLAMLEKTAKGRQVREYFIRCEEELLKRLAAAGDGLIPADLMQEMQGWRAIVERQDEQLRAQALQITGLVKDVAGLAKQALPRSGRSGSELLRLQDEVDSRWPDCPPSWRTLIRLRIKAQSGLDVWNHKHQVRGALVGRREDVELAFIEAINEMRAIHDAGLKGKGKGGGKDQRHFPGMDLN